MNHSQKWEKSLSKFVKKREDKKDVVGMLVCGSYITGNPTKHSDIDIHIILDPNISWRERGNEIIDGILIEYFANPVKRYHEYIEEDFKGRRKMDVHMFTTGEIIFDKTGDLKKLIEYAQIYSGKRYKKQTEIGVELDKYHIRDMCDNLEEVFENGDDDFYIVYYNDLNIILDIYTKFLQFDAIPIHKIKRFLSSDKDKKKYNIKDFPDELFVETYLNAIRLKNNKDMMKEYKKLTEYLLNKMGGFSIDGWKVRSPA